MGEYTINGRTYVVATEDEHKLICAMGGAIPIKFEPCSGTPAAGKIQPVLELGSMDPEAKPVRIEVKGFGVDGEELSEVVVLEGSGSFKTVNNYRDAWVKIPGHGWRHLSGGFSYL